MIKKILSKIFFILSIMAVIYIIICDIFMSFSIIMSLCFVFTALLLFCLSFIFAHDIDEKEKSPSFWYIFIKVFSVFYFSVFLILFLLNIFYKRYYLPKNNSYDYIIVFGAGISNGKTEIISSRLKTAFKYSLMYKKSRFVLTGAKGYNEPIEEAFYMKQYLIENGVPEYKILVDPFSVNTHENIMNSLELIRNDVIRRNRKESFLLAPFLNFGDKFDLNFLNIGFMSSEFHITRINLLARKSGIKKPYDISCKTGKLYLPYSYMRECLSLFKAIVLMQVKF